MVGIDVFFRCANCSFSGIVDMGITDFVNYKGEKLALRSCPKCKKTIAFAIPKEENYKLGNADLNPEGNWMKQDVIGILSNNLDILDKREDEIMNFILSKLKENYSEGYLFKNEVEIKTIIEYVLANKLYIKSYVFEQIKNECTDAGCYCY